VEEIQPGTEWAVPGLAKASEEFAPRAFPADRYLELLAPAWNALIESENSKQESVVQNFLERNPCLIPGAFSVDGESGHAPWPCAVVSQPMLPELSTKRPDFMWIATDSDTTYAVLIEIETPHSRWWYTTGAEVHHELSHGQGQLAEWRAWFNKPRNQIAFADFYELPSLFRRRKLVTRYVLIHGRRSETGEDGSRLSKRRELYREDERLMTFDRLAPSVKATDLLCVTRKPDAYHLKFVPPSFEVVAWNDHRYEAINDWQLGLSNSSEVSPSRAEFVLQEVEASRAEFARGRELGPRAANPR